MAGCAQARGTARLSAPPRCGSRRWQWRICIRQAIADDQHWQAFLACEAAARGRVPPIRTAVSPAARLNIPPYQARQPAAASLARAPVARGPLLVVLYRIEAAGTAGRADRSSCRPGSSAPSPRRWTPPASCWTWSAVYQMTAGRPPE